MPTKPLSPNGRAIEKQFEIMDAEILHESYSCTLDFGCEMSEPYKAQLERKGFAVTHEEGTIYTLQR